MILLIHFKDLPGRTGFEKVLRDKAFKDGKSGPCINFDVENNDKDSTFNVGDHIIKSKHNKATLRVGLKTFF